MADDELESRSVSNVALSRRLVALMVDWGAALAISAGFFDNHPLITLGIFALQRILLGWTLGYSIGQRLVGIRIVRLVDKGRATLVNVTIRTVMLCLVLPALYGTLAGVPLHDYLGGTRLVMINS